LQAIEIAAAALQQTGQTIVLAPSEPLSEEEASAAIITAQMEEATAG
jgi:hypothetical protein